MRVLFVCTANTCRSPMAERLARQLYPQHDWESAGVLPSGVMHRRTAQVLAKRGADADGFRGRSVFELDLQSFDDIVLIGGTAQAAVPPEAGQARLHFWDVDDPYEVWGEEEKTRRAYEDCADELALRIGELVAGFGRKASDGEAAR